MGPVRKGDGRGTSAETKILRRESYQNFKGGRRGFKRWEKSLQIFWQMGLSLSRPTRGLGKKLKIFTSASDVPGGGLKGKPEFEKERSETGMQASIVLRVFCCVNSRGTVSAEGGQACRVEGKPDRTRGLGLQVTTNKSSSKGN